MDLVDQLEDILDSILPEEENSIIESEDFYSVVYELVNEYMKSSVLALMNEDHHETLLNEIFQLVVVQFEFSIKFYDYEKCREKIEEIVQDYYFEEIPGRSCDDSTRERLSVFGNKTRYEVRNITKILDILRNKPQPEQRTSEWYHFRHNLITASNAYKAFMEGSEFNQLVYEKCQPLKIPVIKEDELPPPVNVDTTLHWGQKFEPLSVMIYEDCYCTKIEDFGCIQHDTYSFIGASPDGINVDTNNLNYYGRMLEIKNIVNREITGIPKMEYWVQMQLQMETCGLDECDFFETRFKEFENEQAYLKSFESTNDHEDDDQSKTTCLSYKGVMMYFSHKGKPIYKYSKLNITPDELEIWEEKTMDETISNDVIWVKNNYWWLEESSCVLVMRNKNWFSEAAPYLKTAWETIDTERETGYQHRAPTKRTPKSTPNDASLPNPKCLIQIDKETGELKLSQNAETKDKKDELPIGSPPIDMFLGNEFKVRTESIDETRERMDKQITPGSSPTK